MRSTFIVQRLPGAVVTQESKTKQHKLWDHRLSGANLHAAKIQDDLDRKIKELRDAAFQEQTTLLLNAPNACIVASGLRWEKHPVRGWSHGPREQEQPDADSKPSSSLGPCSASPLADESVGRVLHRSDCVLRSRSSCRPCPVRLRSRSRRVPTIAGHPMRTSKARPSVVWRPASIVQSFDSRVLRPMGKRK